VRQVLTLKCHLSGLGKEGVFWEEVLGEGNGKGEKAFGALVEVGVEIGS